MSGMRGRMKNFPELPNRLDNLKARPSIKPIKRIRRTTFGSEHAEQRY
jgi:hypothetical protein